MRTPRSRHRRPVLPILLAVAVVVIGGLWWTKTIAFTRTADVEFSIPTATASPVDTYQARFIARDTFDSTELIDMMSNRLTTARGGATSDYDGELTVARAPDRSGMILTVRGRTPHAADSLLADATGVLEGILRQLIIRVPTLVVDGPGN